MKASCNRYFNHLRMKYTFFLEGYGSILVASTRDRKQAQRLLTAFMPDFFAEFYENPCSTNLNLW